MPFVSSNTVGDVFDELAMRLNEVSADESVTYLGWVNQCTRDIQASFPNAPFLYTSADRTLSSGTRHYTNLPSDFEKMMTIIYPAGDIKLKYLTEEEFDAVQPSASELGNPTIYTIHGSTTTANNQIEFYPVPNGSITLNYRYRKLLGTVSAPSATLPIPIKYSELYPLFGEKMGLRRREDVQQAEIIESKYEAMKQKMIDDFKRVTEEPWRIKSIREFTPANRRYQNEIVEMFWNNQ